MPVVFPYHQTDTVCREGKTTANKINTPMLYVH